MSNGLHRIFFPTNLEAEAEHAFLHALRLAVAGPAKLTIMHVGEETEHEISSMPQVRRTLHKWGFISGADDSAELKEMGIGVLKLLASGDPLRACLDHLKEHHADLVVLHTHQREGAAAWLSGRVAEPMAREAGKPTLIVPGRTRSFVDAGTGKIRLRRVLIPIASTPDPRKAIELAAWLASIVGYGDVRFTLLHVGEDLKASSIATPQRPPWEWTYLQREGDVLEAILRTEMEIQPDLVVMMTQGHDGFLDALRGSTTERVLRHIQCPLLTATA
ncbi:MAG TPA: universal stress protein [Flavobacteriales bacterium]|nr:universal stress protein [Flavobacteriales bacterium]